MKLKLWILLCALASTPLFYITTQEPKLWCDRQWAGLALYRGGYRSWTLTFCDGFVLGDDGKRQPVVITDQGIRNGYHWPKYGHADLKRMGIKPPPK